MDKELFAAMVKNAFAGVENQVLLPRENVTVPIMDAPIYGFAAADDPIFETFRDPEVIGEKWMPPREWMPEAKTVVVFYFSFSEEIRSRHRASPEPIDEAWVSGYGNHAKVVVPFAKAMTAALEKALRAALPAWVGLRAEPEDAASPWEADADHPLMRLAAETMSEAYGKETVFAGCGASIPLAKLCGELLPGIPVLLTGVEDPLGAVHAPDESLELADFFGGAKAETALFGRLSD